jgi:hypothetical protein
MLTMFARPDFEDLIHDWFVLETQSTHYNDQRASGARPFD